MIIAIALVAIGAKIYSDDCMGTGILLFLFVVFFGFAGACTIVPVREQRNPIKPEIVFTSQGAIGIWEGRQYTTEDYAKVEAFKKNHETATLVTKINSYGYVCDSKIEPVAP